MKLFVSNLPYSVTENQLFESFSQYGEISECHLAVDRETGQSRGFAFVGYLNRRDAMLAIQQMDRTEFNGRPIYVCESTPKPERLTYR